MRHLRSSLQVALLTGCVVGPAAVRGLVPTYGTTERLPPGFASAPVEAVAIPTITR